MPILIESAEFSDVFGSTLPYYQANPGDQTTVKFTMRSAIRNSSINAPLTLDPSTNQVTSPITSWIDEGFRLGDWVRFRRRNSGGAQIGQFWSQINYVDDIIADFTGIPFWYNLTNNQSMELIVVTGNGSTTPRGRDDLDVLVNHSLNSTTGSEFSLIDGEATRAIFQGVAAMAPLSSINGVLVGDQSGQFLISSTLRRLNDNVDNWRVHELEIVLLQSGAYDPEWFQSSDCLKLFMRMEWASLSAEPFARSIVSYTNEANTGFFDEPFNTSPANSVLVSGVSELDYCTPTPGLTMVVDGVLSPLGFGGQYISTDPDYYKNRPYSQQEITMALKTTDAVPGIYASELNEDGAGYTIQITNVANVGPVTTITFTWLPNPQLATFMDSREDGDRNFKLWVKCGNANLLAFDGQLTCEPPVGGPLVMSQDFGYLDHSQNVETAAGDQTGFIADTEDDVAYLGTFLIDKEQVYESFKVEIEAFNGVTLDNFELQKVFFAFSGVQISNDGRYLLNETANVVSTLPNTSVKLNARLILEPSLDTPTQYGVKIYAPWLLNWKNWEQYDDPANWELRTTLTLIEEGLAYTHSNIIDVAPYDNEADINSTIELLQLPALTPITVAPSGSVVRVRSTHVKNTGDWAQSLTWGMLTVEPNEAERRWICSSVVDFDNNTNNPLTPLTGTLISIQFPSPDTAVLECDFDTSKIDLTNGVDIGAKIKENDKDITGFLLTVRKEAALGYSVMKIADDGVWTGPLMRIRRSSDNAEQDFNAVYDGTNWVLDVVAVVAFTGDQVGDNGYVTDWYDQSDEGKTATQTVLTDQPQIVLDGVVITDPANGFPALEFDGVNHNFDVVALPASPNYCQAFQFTRETDGPAIRSIGVADSGGPYPSPLVWQNGILFDFMGQNFGGSNVHASGQTQTGSFLNLSYRKLDDDIKMRLNGTQLTTINEALTGGQLFRKIGQQATGHHIGKMQELVLYSQSTDFDEQFIEDNINFRYQTF